MSQIDCVLYEVYEELAGWRSFQVIFLGCCANQDRRAPTSISAIFLRRAIPRIAPLPNVVGGGDTYRGLYADVYSGLV